MRFLGDNVPNLKLIDSSLRLFVVPLSVASVWLTVTNQEDNTTYGKISFNNFTGLKYMVCISAISGGYALVAAVSTWVKLFVTKAWVFFISDQLVAYLMVTSEAAVAEIMYLSYHGDIKVSWSEACTSYGSFCNRLKLILSINSIAICCFFVLAVISAYRAFSIFEPPFLPPKEVQEEQRT